MVVILKKFIVFSALVYSVGAAANASDACELGRQFIIGDNSTALVQTGNKRNQPIINAVTKRHGMNDDKRFGRYMPEVVSQNNFEAESIYIAKSQASRDVTIIVNNSAYVLLGDAGYGSAEKSAGLETLYLDSGNDLVTINGRAYKEHGYTETIGLVEKAMHSQSVEEFNLLPKAPGHFVCRLQAGAWSNNSGLLRKTEFAVPYSVLGYVYANGGAVNYGVPARSLRYYQGD